MATNEINASKSVSSATDNKIDALKVKINIEGITSTQLSSIRLKDIESKQALSNKGETQVRVIANKQDFEKGISKELIGKKISITYAGEQSTDYSQEFNGYIAEVSDHDAAGDFSNTQKNELTIIIVPWIWFLDLNKNCKIFQSKTVIDIIEEVLKDFDSDIWQLDVTKTDTQRYPKREYTVQYRQSDYEFITQLIEENGLYYYFINKDGKNKLVIKEFGKAPEPMHETIKEIEYVDTLLTQGDVQNKANKIVLLNPDEAIAPTKITYKNYNSKKPSQKIEGVTDDLSGRYDDLTVGGKKLRDIIENYDFPEENHIVEGKTAAITQQQMSFKGQIWDIQQRTASSLIYGSGTSLPVKVGHSTVFKAAEGHELPVGLKDESKFVFLEITHKISSSGYNNDFVCVLLDDSNEFLPEAVLMKPKVEGIQTATVVGPQDEEIYTDEMGRIKVQFHWDRYGKKDENSTCWIRYAQFWAGPQRGIRATPRIGDEVVVDFIENDPDRPLIIGSVYNGKNLPVHNKEQSTNQTAFTIRSKSTKNGEVDQYNEIKLEDKKDSEEFSITAQRRLITTVKENHDETIMHNWTSNIKNDTKINSEHSYQLITDNFAKTFNVGVIDANQSMITNANLLYAVKSKKAVTFDCEVYTLNANQTVAVNSKNIIALKADMAISMIAPNINFQTMTSFNLRSPIIQTKADLELKMAAGLDPLNCIRMTQEGILIRLDEKNYIKITKAGIVIKGATVALNPLADIPEILPPPTPGLDSLV